MDVTNDGARVRRVRPLAPEVEAAMAAVVERALGTRPARGAKWWHPAVEARLEGSGHPVPPLGTLRMRFAAERARRRTGILELARTFAARIGDGIGEGSVRPLPDAAPIGRRTGEAAVLSLSSTPSSSPGDAYREFAGAAYRSGVPSMPKEAFLAFVLSPDVVAAAPPGIMPGWWLRRLERDRNRTVR